MLDSVCRDKDLVFIRQGGTLGEPVSTALPLEEPAETAPTLENPDVGLREPVPIGPTVGETAPALGEPTPACGEPVPSLGKPAL